MDFEELRLDSQEPLTAKFAKHMGRDRGEILRVLGGFYFAGSAVLRDMHVRAPIGRCAA
jgi:hypothetical protein